MKTYKAYQTISLKQIIVLLVMIIVSYGCDVRQSQLQERNGLFYKINSETPYTGRMVAKYPNGQKQHECTYKDGKQEGTGTWWHSNGQKLAEHTYKDGKLEGTLTEWHENGQKKQEVTYKDGKPINKKSWDKDGNLE